MLRRPLVCPDAIRVCPRRAHLVSESCCRSVLICAVLRTAMMCIVSAAPVTLEQAAGSGFPVRVGCANRDGARRMRRVRACGRGTAEARRDAAWCACLVAQCCRQRLCGGPGMDVPTVGLRSSRRRVGGACCYAASPGDNAASSAARFRRTVWVCGWSGIVASRIARARACKGRAPAMSPCARSSIA